MVAAVSLSVKKANLGGPACREAVGGLDRGPDGLLAVRCKPEWDAPQQKPACLVLEPDGKVLGAG